MVLLVTLNRSVTSSMLSTGSANSLGLHVQRIADLLDQQAQIVLKGQAR